MKRTRGDKAVEGVIILLLAVICFTMLYPFWNSLIISLNEGRDTARGGITFWVRKPTLDSYEVVLKDKRFLNAFAITVLRTLAGTAVSILLTSLFAYALTKKQLKMRKLYMILAVITMYFGGGLIPTYILIRDLGLRDRFMVYIIPGAISVWNMIIFRTFFRGVSPGLEESARIDGAGYYGIFFRILLPVSLPVFSTLSLFTAVGHWNSWFDAAIYIRSSNLMPIQNLLRTIINANSMSEMLSKVGGAASEQMQKKPITTRSLVMATMMVATVPILTVYPFIQKYFVQGVMIGSLKE